MLQNGSNWVELGYLFPWIKCVLRTPWLCLCNWKKMDKGSEALSHLLWHSWCPCAEMYPLHQAECLHLNFLLGTSLSICYQPNWGPALAVRVNWHRLNNCTECTGQLRQLQASAYLFFIDLWKNKVLEPAWLKVLYHSWTWIIWPMSSGSSRLHTPINSELEFLFWHDQRCANRC